MKANLFPIATLTIGAVILLTLNCPAQTNPRLLPFQGRLTDADGNPVSDGARVVQFKIYDAPVGGRAVWNGEVQKLTVNGGLINTLLGTKANLASVDFDLNLYLELTIDANADGQITAADPPLLPRQSILPAVFAKESADSRLLKGYNWSALFGASNPADGTLLDSKIRDGSISAAKLIPASINSSLIANGAVTRAKLDVSGAIAGQTLQYNGSTVNWTSVNTLSAPNGSSGVFVDTTGNVGIKTSTPGTASLAVNGGVRARGGPPGGVGANNNGYAFIGSGGDNDSGMFSSGDGLLQFFTDSAERVRVTGSGVAILGANVLELGLGIAKEVNAGKIGYQAFSGDALDIVGAGTVGGNRRINLYAEGGTVFVGPIGMFDQDIRFRALNDGLHFLGWRNSMGNQSGFDGPALVGNNGGVLGVGGGDNWSLRWNRNGSVNVRGSLSQNCDRDVKENFAPVNASDVLKKVVALPITRWNYKDDPRAEHIGPVAQDFRAAFGLGSDEKSIATVDTDGVALVAIQGLYKKLEEKEAEIRQLNQRLERLERLLSQNPGGGQ